MALMMSFSGSIDMVLPYMTIFGTIFSVNTISFDEADNGYSYIMTLPVTYKDYVYEKYMFCTAGGIAVGLVTMVFFLIGTGIRGTAVVTSDILIAAAAVLPPIVIIESFLIPVQLRFGNSKSRIFIMFVIGAVIARDKAVVCNNWSGSGYDDNSCRICHVQHESYEEKAVLTEQRSGLRISFIVKTNISLRL